MEKTRFDERQEKQLLRIEHIGSAIGWWGLLTAIAVQWVLFGSDFSRLGGEIAVFIPLSLYLGVSPIAKGLRDRYWPGSLRGKLWVSLVFGAAAACLNAAAVWLHPKRAWNSTAGMFLILLISMFFVSFLSLSFLQKLTDHRAKRLEKEPDDEQPQLLKKRETP